MTQNSSGFSEKLVDGKAQTLVIFGTSLSYHLTPLMRSALQSRVGELASIVNSGMAGNASRTALAQLEEKVLKHKPDTLLMEWAINDAHDYQHDPGGVDQGISIQESRDNLEELISRVQSAFPETEIILWTTNSTDDVEGSTMRGRSARPELEGYYLAVREVASARGLRLIDGEKFWNSTREQMGNEFRTLIPDGVHPTPKALREHLVPFLLDELGVPTLIS
jgi:lysophospholipase L1-like esterase